MFSVTPSTEWDVISDSLAGLLAMLHPKAGMGSRGVVLEAARRLAVKYLRQLRHHLHENGLLWWAMEKAEPACIASSRRIAVVHGEFRRLSHNLCRRIRREDAQGAREVARTLLAFFLEHFSEEKLLVNHILRKLDRVATGRFADALLDRMLSDMAMRKDPLSSRESLVDLHSHYVHLIRHLQGRTEDPQSIEVQYEDPCRR